MSSGKGTRLGIAEYFLGVRRAEMKIQNEKFPLSHFLRKAEERRSEKRYRMRPNSISLDMIYIRVYINTFKWKNKMRFRG